MRNPDIHQDTLFSTANPDLRDPKDHPLRSIRTMVDEALRNLDADFNPLYSGSGVIRSHRINACWRNS